MVGRSVRWLWLAWLAPACGAAIQEPEAPAAPPNILMIVADDLNWDSVGCYGSPVEGVTPHIDALASQGMRFGRAHVTVAACQPSRSVWMTGRYPHRNGAEGFEPIDEGVPTLVEKLREAGYFTGIIGKINHLTPKTKFPFDYDVPSKEWLGWGRNARRYYQATKGFLKEANKQGKPFFLMANSHDPKRPFAGSAQEKHYGRTYPVPPRVYEPSEVEVPASLPDLPEVRLEVAQYFTSVNRFDVTLGRVLEALAEAGLEDDTVVVFASDHGMAFPFAKMNCYLNSTKVPFIVRWPGVVDAGRVDDEHFVSGVDLMPTLLEIAQAEECPGMDGRSFAPLLRGRPQDGRDQVVTVFHKTRLETRHEMRCVQRGAFGYIYNAWAGRGGPPMSTEAMSGLSFPAMRRAAEKDAGIRARVELLQNRVPEELYDFDNDPHALVNLIEDPAYQDEIKQLRSALLAHLERFEDPLRGEFAEFTAR